MSTPAQRNQHWYRKKLGEAVHDEIVAHGQWMLNLYKSVHQIDRIHERIYENPRMRRYGAAVNALTRVGLDLARLNVTKSIVDTVGAKISKRRSMPAFAVDNADWSLKRKAKEYRKWLVGKQMETDFDRLSVEAVTDGEIIGTGITKIGDAGGDDIVAERVFRDEVLIDPREMKYGKPNQLVQVKRVARDVLAAHFPKFEKQIMDAKSATRRANEDKDDDELVRVTDLEDYVDVWMAWRLPVNGEGGQYAMVTDGITFVHAEWKRPRFPFAFMKYSTPRRGFWGRGLVADLADIQHRINCTVRDIQLNLEATGRGHVLVNEANDVPVEMLTAAQPFKLKYKGTSAPTFNAPMPFHPAQLQALKEFIAQAWELSGVSQSSGTSQSPLGPGASGVAINTMWDRESERYGKVEDQYANYRLDAAQCYLDGACDIAERRRKEGSEAKRRTVSVPSKIEKAKAKGDGMEAIADAGIEDSEDKKKREKEHKEKYGYWATWKSGDAIQRLCFDDVMLEEGRYSMQLEPVNFVPDTRAGKLATVGELTKAGIIPSWLAAALFDEPDIARANEINLASYHNWERKLEIAEDEEQDLMPAMPEPYNDLALGLKMSKAYYERAQTKGAPEAVLDRLRQVVDAIIDMQGTAESAAPPPVMPTDAIGGPAPPGAMPNPGSIPPEMMMPPVAA